VRYGFFLTEVYALKLEVNRWKSCDFGKNASEAVHTAAACQRCVWLYLSDLVAIEVLTSRNVEILFDMMLSSVDKVRV